VSSVFCQRVGNILPKYGASVARIHVHEHTRTHPLTRHAQIKTGDLESINVLTNPQLQHRVMIQTTSTPLTFRLFSQLFFFSRTQLTIKVFFSMSSDFSQIMNGGKKKKIERKAGVIEKKFSTMHFFHSVFLGVVCIMIAEHFYSPPMNIFRLTKKKKTRNSERMRQE